MHKEESLGGTMNRVVKIGDTVHRVDKGGEMLHAYLRYLEARNMPSVPRFRGIDGQGREILTYLPGRTQDKDRLIGQRCLTSDETLADAARFMRKLHDVSVGFLPQALECGWGNPDYPQDAPETICHNDAATWNFVFVGDRLAGLFDFDTACPGTRMWDLTLPVFSFLPATPFVSDPERGGEAPYDSARHAPERRRRLKLFFEAYGAPCPDNFLELLLFRMRDFCRHSTGQSLAWYTRVVAHIEETGRDWMI